MTKYFVLFALILGTKSFGQSDSSMRMHVYNVFDATADYVLSHTKTETIEKKKHLPKQKYQRLRAVYDTATKSYKPVFEDYKIRLGEELKSFDGEYYYSVTYKAYLFPIRESEVEKEDKPKQKDGSFGKALLGFVERYGERILSQRLPMNGVTPGYIQPQEITASGYVRPVY